jgi:hypothetical protein
MSPELKYYVPGIDTLLRDVDMIDPQKISFHEATIIAFQMNDGTLELKLTGVFTDEGARDIEIFISGVNHIEVDGEVADSASMPFPDGEVLSLALSHDSLSLLVEWNDFSNRTSCTMSYEVCGESLSVTLAVPKEQS